MTKARSEKLKTMMGLSQHCVNGKQLERWNTNFVWTETVAILCRAVVSEV